MKVIKCERTNNDEYSFKVLANEEEVGVMINIALGALIYAGHIEEDLEEDTYIDLASIPIEELYKA